MSTNKQCTNCPGATDHDTAHCPLMLLRERFRLNEALPPKWFALVLREFDAFAAERSKYLERAEGAPLEAQGVALHVVFDGPPGPESGRFVECETPDGRSINAGEWQQRPDGLFQLVVPGRVAAALAQPYPTRNAHTCPRSDCGSNSKQEWCPACGAALQ